jgi:hypothetical protein
VFRVVALFAGGFLLFLLVRSALVPPDFGVYGFYRAGALADNRARPVAYAGQMACVDCHSEVIETRKAGRHATIACEACHGPLARHAAGNFDPKPTRLDPRQLCLQCHARSAGKPASFPQMVAVDHSPEGACATCHQPHRPKIE